jgi:hypothetical protein
MASTSVTLRIDETVWRRTRAYAFLNGVTASSIVEEYLRELVMDSNQEGSVSASDDQSGPEAVDPGEDRVVHAKHIGDEDRGRGRVPVS